MVALLLLVVRLTTRRSRADSYDSIDVLHRLANWTAAQSTAVTWTEFLCFVDNYFHSINAQILLVCSHSVPI